MITLLIAGAGIEPAIVITFYVIFGVSCWWYFTSGAMDDADDWEAIEDAVCMGRG